MAGKYGNLHSKKIHNKLSKCKPALDLLFIVGFKISNNNKRLIWSNTTNNLVLISYLYDQMQRMKGKRMISNDKINEEFHEGLTTAHQNMAMQNGHTHDEVSSIAVDPDWIKAFYVKCSCNTPMKMKYCAGNIACDSCGNDKNIMLLHCPNKSAHTNGYHLCLYCSIQKKELMMGSNSAIHTHTV